MKDRLKRVGVRDGCTRYTIRFCWLLTPALAIQVFPTGLLPTRGALCGVGIVCRAHCVTAAFLTFRAGEKGYFRIRRGQNDCGFEAGVLGGMPDV